MPVPPHAVSAMTTKKKPARKSPATRVRDRDEETLRPSYDLSQGRRGVTAARYAQGTNVVILDADVSALFPTSASVNDALRVLAGIAQRTVTKRSRQRE